MPDSTARTTTPPNANAPDQPLISARGIFKQYGAVRALAGADLDIYAGQVTALLGANGSGKSTLGRVITGITRPDSGSLTFEGRPLHLRSPVQARQLGITAVYQELSLVPDLSVAENVWLGHEPRRMGGIDRRAMRAKTAELLESFQDVFTAPVSPDTTVERLPASERQLVEVVKALAWQPRVLVLDEATSSLDSRQVDRLFELVQQWRAQGMALVFISHRMEEIFRVADRAAVVRNGISVGQRHISEATERQLVQLMTGGGEVAAIAQGRQAEDAVGSEAPVVLRLTEFSSTDLQPLDLELRRGELVGLGGLQGQGQRQLLLALFGAAPHHGQMLLGGEQVRFRSPRQAQRAGVAYVPGDRNREGLLPVRPILENLQLPGWRKYGVPLRLREARADAGEVAEELVIKFDSLDEPVANLSGGNAQKVVIGKWLLQRPRLLLLDDPTRGVDVNAKAEFYRLLGRLQEQGTTILFHSSDDAELLGLCQRVLVLQDGHVTARLTGQTLDRQHLVAAAMGAHGAVAHP